MNRDRLLINTLIVLSIIAVVIAVIVGKLNAYSLADDNYYEHRRNEDQAMREYESFGGGDYYNYYDQVSVPPEEHFYQIAPATQPYDELHEMKEYGY